ncbi:MAG: proline--tRNA ligase [Candidatus Micrarchaeota archaeon]
MKLDKKNFSEWYNTVLADCDIVDLRYPVKGMPVYKAWGFKTLRKCFELLERALNESGHEEMLFPILVPEDVFGKEAEHIRGFGGEVLWVTHGGEQKLERNLALRPTSETIMYPMFALWIRSHADLPLKLHQTVCIYRSETKATRPLIRGREVYWSEAHTAHATPEDAEKQIAEGVRIYGDFFHSLGIPFTALKRPEYDKFAGAKYSIAFDILMPDGKTLQSGTVHNLGENFARVYDVAYSDEKGEKHFCSQTCYGLSMRCLASVISVHGDDKGLVLPPIVSPIQAVIIPIFVGENKEAIAKKCESLALQLKKAEIRAHVDARDVRPGEKFYYWESRGIPVRVELGPKDMEKKQVVLVNRVSGKKRSIAEKELVEELQKEFEESSKELFARAEKELKARIKSADSMSELKKIFLKENGFVKVGWCGSAECADSIKTETGGAEVRGSSWPEKKERKKCIFCGKEGEATWIAKAY